MNTLPDNEFDLEKLFLPSWAQEPASAKYAHYEGETERPDRREGRRGPRPPRRDFPPGGRRDDNRPRGDRRGPRPQGGGRDRGPMGDRGPRRDDARERREPPAPLPEIEVSLLPEAKGVESLSRQIKMTGRAYPLFDIAQMILQKPERHMVAFGVKKNAEGQAIQPLVTCALDDTLWLSEDEAVQHVLKKHFATFYQAERTPTEPPKGKYTFVAQCGMSGEILGPPNYHDYQTRLHKLHADRFSRMPFDVYKSRVRIVRDEEVVKKWVEEQSFKTEYVCLNLPEPLRLGNLEAVEKHFREVHKDNIIKQTEGQTLTGTAARNLRNPQLSRLVRQVWEDQRRFPLQIATTLSQQFASHGLQFFKVNRTVTHVSVARPHYLDLDATPVSEGVKRIVDYINANPKCNRRLLIEALAPSPAPAAAVVPVEGQPPAAPAASQPDANQPTPEQTAIIADLHWLVHQGHVIEFANGILETAKKPLPKPPKPEPKREQKPAEAAPAAAVPAETAEQPIPEAPAAAPAVGAAAPGVAEPAAEAPAPAPSPETVSESAAPEAAPNPVPEPAASPSIEPPTEASTESAPPEKPPGEAAL